MFPKQAGLAAIRERTLETPPAFALFLRLRFYPGL